MECRTQWQRVMFSRGMFKDSVDSTDVPPPPLSFPSPGKTVPHHPLGDGHQVTVPHPPPGGLHHHRTRTFAGTEIAA